MGPKTGHSILVTRPDLTRLRLLLESPRLRRRWDEIHLLALAEELEDADVVEPERIPADAVTMHSRVRVRDLASGDEVTYTLAYPSEADATAGRLSVLAPIGSALLGCREGDVIERPVPRGVRVLKVVKVLHQAEAAARAGEEVAS